MTLLYLSLQPRTKPCGKYVQDDQYDYLYTKKELRPRVNTIRALSELAEITYVVTNNHFRGQAVVNAFERSSMLGRYGNLIPAMLTTRYPQLLTLGKT